MRAGDRASSGVNDGSDYGAESSSGARCQCDRCGRNSDDARRRRSWRPALAAVLSYDLVTMTAEWIDILVVDVWKKQKKREVATARNLCAALLWAYSGARAAGALCM